MGCSHKWVCMVILLIAIGSQLSVISLGDQSVEKDRWGSWRWLLMLKLYKVFICCN
ncbi:hypothetical protein Hdeb2414_s0004g00128321 [Helianthus debilis subsp. tardiflorus]